MREIAILFVNKIAGIEVVGSNIFGFTGSFLGAIASLGETCYLR
ncbi:MAG: hypothetical protein AB4290_30395 [Spirulina sp.]